MEGPLLRIIISSKSVNKHSHHRQLWFVIGRFKHSYKKSFDQPNWNLVWSPYRRFCIIPVFQNKMTGERHRPSPLKSWQGVRGRCGRDRMVVGFTPTYAISAHHHWYSIFDQGEVYTTLCDKVCQWLATGLWSSPGPPVSSTNKTDRHDIAEILLKVALNSIKQTYKQTSWHSDRVKKW